MFRVYCFNNKFGSDGQIVVMLLVGVLVREGYVLYFLMRDVGGFSMGKIANFQKKSLGEGRGSGSDFKGPIGDGAEQDGLCQGVEC